MRRPLWSLAALILLAACSAAETSGGTPAEASGDPATTSPSETAAPMVRSPIDGVYHVTITVQDGVDAGLTPRQAGDIDGKVETTFSFGTVRQFIDGGVLSDGFMGTFVVDGDEVILTDYNDVPLTLGYELNGPELTFTIAGDPAPEPGAAFDAALWTSHPFIR